MNVAVLMMRRFIRKFVVYWSYYIVLEMNLTDYKSDNALIIDLNMTMILMMMTGDDSYNNKR